MLRRLNHSLRLSWSDVQVATISGFFSLTFCRSRSDVLSLTLSWGASLALAGFSAWTRAKRTDQPAGLLTKIMGALKRQVFIFVCLTPLLLPLAPPHPLTILTNWILGPLLEALLFPLSLAAVVFHRIFPSIVFVTDGFWSFAIAVLGGVAHYLPSPLPSARVAHAWPWAYLGVLSLGFLIALPKWQQRSSSNARPRNRPSSNPLSSAEESACDRD
jgi:hypothetical protein